MAACPILTKEQYMEMIECVLKYTLTRARKEEENETMNTGMNVYQN
jgi:hypothetical protein